MSKKKILGDFQTPVQLARNVVSRLFADGLHWERVLEPTCGQGNFIRACVEQAAGVREIIGLEIQQSYVEKAKRIRSETVKVSICQQDIFDINLATSLQWHTSSPLLILGNPPWITNAEQGRLNGKNLPKKSNFQRLSGLDAITGKSNFDIAEAVWLKLIHEFANETVTIALLCKTSVARKVAQFALDNALPVNSMSLYRIEAQRWFKVAVDAGLFALELNQGDISYEVAEFDGLLDARHTRTFGFHGGKIVADLDAYRQVASLEGASQLIWRQGLKHDAAKVMELTYRNGILRNGYGDHVDIETDYLYPLLKSSDAHAISSGFVPRKYVIVTQKKVGQQTMYLRDHAPKLWTYLSLHTGQLGSRKSSIYKNAPQFSMFGIGEYSFQPYKIVVSGFYLPARFVVVSGYQGKQILIDDTCYSLSFDEEWQARLICALLNHPAVSKFLASITFPDSKRPITKSVLQRINLRAVYDQVNIDKLMNHTTDSYNISDSCDRGTVDIQLRLFEDYA
ncbi:MAG: SAM-dependent methyltransferase [Chloroflexota bacterium]|nr:SAM-dependent methyltransferase [Chloroflexota bacterium]